MLSFVSFKFVLFLTLSFFFYYLCPIKYRNYSLLLFSYLYYYLNSHLLVLVLFFVSLFTYLIGELLTKYPKNKKILLPIGIIGILSILIYFKYYNFIIDNINVIFNSSFAWKNLLLPLGISFYSLQAIAYLIDIAKNKCQSDHNILHFFLFMSYFPQIIQGPIPRYKKLSKELSAQHPFDYYQICQGLQLMLYGIAKKVIIADRLAKPVAYIFDNGDQFKGLFILFGAILYSFQIYTDFSGGIDAIRGISQVFGITLDDNFNQPYFSKSIEEFWRRWHISLGNWMKDYIFYPISLSKHLNKLTKKMRNLFNDYIGKRIVPCLAMFVVYLLVGLWHGADWKYAIYGIYNGLFIMCGILLAKVYKSLLERFKIKTNSKSWQLFQMIRTFMIVSIGRIFSRADNLSLSFIMLKSLFKNIFDLSDFNKTVFINLGLNMPEWILMIIMLLIVWYFDYLNYSGVKIRESIARKNIFIRWMLYYSLIIAILVFGLYGPGYDGSSFIYGQF